MGILNIRVWGGGVLANPEPPQRLFVMTSGTDMANEIRCAAAVRSALGAGYGSPAQAALRRMAPIAATVMPPLQPEWALRPRQG